MKVGTDGVTLGAWARCAGRVLDAGCGCGLIGLMAAQRGALSVSMVEIDPAAAAEAATNAAASPWSDRVTALCADFLEFTGGEFDCILSNPPFFATGELAPDTARATARHEGRLSPQSFMKHSAGLLAPGGTVSIIVPPDRAPEWTFAAGLNGLRPARAAALFTRKRAAEPRRILLEFSREGVCGEPQRLEIHSEEYQTLVKDFYL